MNKITFILLLSFSFSALSDSEVTIENAWIRALPPILSMTAGYLSITNHSDHPVTISGVSGDNFGLIEMHETIEKNGVVTMVEQPFVMIPAKSIRQYKPGALHLMLMEIKHPIQLDKRYPMRLHFHNGSTLDFIATVKKN